jgi:hypothetical protein
MRVLLVGPDYEENLSIRYLSSTLLAAGSIPPKRPSSMSLATLSWM